MNLHRDQFIHSAIGGAPKVVSAMATDAPTAPRTFIGVGAPSAATLPAGNGIYNAGQSGGIVSISLVNGGANYKPGDNITVVNLPVTVMQVDVNGAIIDWVVTDVMQMAAYPNNPVINVTGGSGAGAQFSLNFPAPDLYVDMTTATAPVVYICTVAGTNAGSTWAQISGGSGGGISLYNLNVTYANGAEVYKPNGTNAGTWANLSGAPIVAGSNNIAALTFPLPANCPWTLIAFAAQPIGACSIAGQSTVYANISAPI